MDHPLPSLKFVSAKELNRSQLSFENYGVEDPGGEKLGNLEGFIMDVALAIPYYAVVQAGGWFRTKHVLIPIGHVALDTESKKLIADVPKERVKRFPGFDLDLFPKLAQKDLDQMADEIAGACCPDMVIEPVVSRVEVWAHYRTPTWWDNSYYTERPDAADRERSKATS